MVSVANGALLDYEAAHSWQIGVRTADRGGLHFDNAFTIALTDVYEGPFGFGPITAPLAASAGDEAYVVDNAGDVMVENAGEGNDMVWNALIAANAMFAAGRRSALRGIVADGGYSRNRT